MLDINAVASLFAIPVVLIAAAILIMYIWQKME